VWLDNRRIRSGVPLLGWAVLVVSPARAETAPEGHLIPAEGYQVDARISTSATLFRRALLPGPAGAVVAADSAAPLITRFDLRSRRLDTPWAANSLDVELSAWANAWLLAPSHQEPWEADLITANVTDHFGPLQVRAGRQIVSGGAARFAHFDGLSAGTITGSGIGVFVYGGWTVLPQWDRRPGYYQLGSARDTLLSDPEAYSKPNRAGWWLAGTRLSYSYKSLAGLSASLHEERESSELGRRDLGLDACWSTGSLLDFSGRGLLDLDSGRVTEAVLSAGLYPTGPLEVTAEVRHVTPALLLSRQSVLSVFDTAPFDEAGGHARHRFGQEWVLDGHAYLQLIDADSLGLRAGMELLHFLDPRKRGSLRVGYRRVSEQDHGYHTVRLSLSWCFAPTLSVLADEYLYYYDQAIRGYKAASVQDATLQWTPTNSWQIGVGSSLFSSPYARWDAQAVLRLSYAFGREAGQL
jgi:hypothetical protein